MGCGGAKPPPSSQGQKVTKDAGKGTEPESAPVVVDIPDTYVMSETDSGPPPPDPAALLYERIEDAKHVFLIPHDLCLFGSTFKPDGQVTPGDANVDASTSCHAVIESEFAKKEFEFSCSSGNKDSAKCQEQLASDGIGFTCRKARKPKASNQDNIVFLRAGGFTVAGVIDGHGDSGHWVSHWAARYVAAMVLEEACAAGTVPTSTGWHKLFNLTHEALQLRSTCEGFDLKASGCTLTVIVIDHKAKSFDVGWVGDSCCVYGCSGGSSVKKMTLEHKPEKAEERMRIFGAGGEVKRDGSGCHRVSQLGNPNAEHGLAVSRAIGDVQLHSCGIIHQPGTTSLSFGTDDGPFVIVASDGIWDMVEEQEASELVGKLGRAAAGEAAEALAKLSRERWIERSAANADTDDISVIVVWLSGA